MLKNSIYKTLSNYQITWYLESDISNSRFYFVKFFNNKIIQYEF